MKISFKDFRYDETLRAISFLIKANFMQAKKFYYVLYAMNRNF